MSFWVFCLMVFKNSEILKFFKDMQRVMKYYP